ncbi:MAG: NfeD family protein [Candidatus Zixiibacteriota bacterium]
MAARYGRNAEWAEKAVRESASITSDEALKLNVIDVIADDVDDLLEKINGREVKTTNGMVIINTEHPIKQPLRKSLIYEILDILVNPNVVFALLALGGLGIMMEIYNPGAIFPGVIGAVCLIVAGYGIRILPISTAGVLLLILALILFIMEIKIVSHGLLTIGGVISLILGGMMLIDSPDPYLQVSISVIIAVAIVVGGFATFSIFYIVKARMTKPTTGGEGLIGETGIVKTKIDNKGYIYVAGELWEATADEVIDIGSEVEVIDVSNLRVKVKKKL